MASDMYLDVFIVIDNEIPQEQKQAPREERQIELF